MCWCLCVRFLSLLCVACSWSGRVRCVLSSAGSGPGYDTVFSVVLMRTLQRSDAGCKSPPPFLSVTGSYLMCAKLSDKNDTCKHGQCCCFFECCHHCVCAVVLSSSPAQYFSSTNTQMFHIKSVYLICYWYLHQTRLSLAVNMQTMVCPRGWCGCWSLSVSIHVCLCQPRPKYRLTALQDGCKSHLYCSAV